MKPRNSISNLREQSAVNVKLFRPPFIKINLDFVELSLMNDELTNIIKLVQVTYNDTTTKFCFVDPNSIDYKRINKTFLNEIRTTITDPKDVLFNLLIMM